MTSGGGTGPPSAADRHPGGPKTYIQRSRQLPARRASRAISSVAHADAQPYPLTLRGDLEAVVRAAYRRGRNDALDAAIANYDCGELAVIEHREDEDSEAAVIEDLLG